MSYLIARSNSVASPETRRFLSETFGQEAQIQDQLPDGFPYLVNEQTFEPVILVLRFILSKTLNGRRSLATAKNLCDHMYEWMLYLNELNLRPDDVGIRQIEDYRDRLAAAISPLTRQPLAAGTVAARVGTVLEFYLFLQKEGHVPGDTIPEITPKKRPLRESSHRHGQRQTNKSKSKFIDRPKPTLIEFISDKDLPRLMAALGGPPDSDGARSRDWLLAVLCATTAIRISEALDLTFYQILELEPEIAGNDIVQLRLVKTKGGRPRKVAVPSDVIRMLLKYIDGERQVAVDAGLLYGPGRKRPSGLFVNGLDAPAPHIGKPYKRKRAEERFAAVQLAIGMTREVPIYDLQTHQLVGMRKIARHVFHHLRHTWAIHAWHQLRMEPPADRWSKIQHQLGHKSQEVTSNTYLRAVGFSEKEAWETYSNALKLIIKARR